MGSKQMNLRDKLDGDELDLSMMRLTEIPVTEIAAIPRAKKIDLSNNELVNVSSSLATYLSHVTKLDLSSNKITSLPREFGELVNLKHLDLYNNQLTELPLTLCNLKNLRYIDLKNNPLGPELSKAVGSCTDSKECQLAAKNVLIYLDKQNQKKINAEISIDRKLKALEMAKQRQEEEQREREREKKKAEKKAQKEKRRLEILSKESNGALQNGKNTNTNKRETEKKGTVSNGNKDIKNNNNNNNNSSSSSSSSSNRKGSGSKSTTNSSSTRKWSMLGLFNMFLLLVILVAAGSCAALYAEGDLSVEGLKAAWPRVKRNSVFLFNRTKEGLKYENLKQTAETCWKTIGPFALKVQEVLILSFNASKNLALNAFNALQTVTGDLMPYVEGVKPFWNTLVKNFWSGCGLAVGWVSSLDWCCLVGSLKWTATFIVDQIRVANAELWRNEAVLSGWEDIKPVREFIWNNTETVRTGLWQLGTDIQTYWLPVIEREIYTLYASGKKHVESLLS